MKHDFDSPPVGVHRVEAREIVDRVQAALVLVEALQSHLLTQYLEELVEQWRLLVVVEYLLLGVLSLLDVNHADLELGLDEHLVELEQLLRCVGQLSERQGRIDVHLLAQTLHHLLPIVSVGSFGYSAD